MREDLLHQIALTLIPNIGPVQTRALVEHFGDARTVFNTRESELRKVTGLGEVKSNSIKTFRDFARAEEEVLFIEKYGIRPLFFSDPDYPRRLLNCYDAPSLLYAKGNADFNASRIVAIIGTRNHTEYGRQLTENLLAGLAAHSVLVISGLAYGIDALAHKAAMENKLATVGVLAHGLDLVYPSLHTTLAREMIRDNGGLITEFTSRTKPDKHHFPTRNRIVAGMSDAVITVETGVKGGSMITAELANGYNRDVFAYPGRTTDNKSAGCNHLIRTNKAVLLTNATDLLELMNWDEKKRVLPSRQKELFIELNTEEKTIADILKEKEQVHIDEINFRSGLSSSQVAATLLNLELRNIVHSLPGKLYRLL